MRTKSVHICGIGMCYNAKTSVIAGRKYNTAKNKNELIQNARDYQSLAFCIVYFTLFENLLFIS